MTWRKRTIIEMAYEAGFGNLVSMPHIKVIEAFAALVRADEVEKYKWDVHSCGPTCKRYACAAMREAVQAEPDACKHEWFRTDAMEPRECRCIKCGAWNTAPPQRTWVGLTEEDLKLLSAEWRIVYGAWMDDFAQDIEAKLKEKNYD